MHRALQRQLKRHVGISDPDSIGCELQRLRAECADLSPESKSIIDGLEAFIDRVDSTYEQHERDMDLRTRSLDLSSAELNEANLQLRADIAARNRAMGALREVLAGLLGAGPRSGTANVDAPETLEQLSASIRNLVSEREQQRSKLDNLKFALDQHAIVSIADQDGIIIYANERLQSLSGYSSGELMGNNHRILKSGIQEDAFYREMWQTISSGKVWHGEYANRRKDGQHYWVAGTIVPLRDNDDKIRQYISIQTDISDQKRTEHQLGMFQKDLVRLLEQYRAAELEIANSRARELEVGAQIQRTLLFGRLPRRYRNIDIATFTQPSQGIDGDFYEFFSFGDDVFDTIIGDVMGKGIPAALMGAAVKKQLNRSAAWLLSQNPVPGYRPPPEEIVNTLHGLIGSELVDLNSFVTLSYLRIDLDSSQALLVDAGHLPVIHVSQAGVSLVRGDNLPLGVLEEERYRQTSVSFRAGDLFFMYSDGITEVRNAAQEEFGLDRLVDQLGRMHAADIPPTMMVQNVRWHVNEFESHAAAQDDRTCVALQIALPLPAGVAITRFELPRALDKLAPLRKKIEAAGAPAALDEGRTQELVIAAFEAATNIVRHTPERLADATIQCTLTVHHDQLELDLYYLGSAFTPHEHEPDFSGESEGGFGLFIIRNSVDLVEYSSPVEGICRIRLVKHASGAPS